MEVDIDLEDSDAEATVDADATESVTVAEADATARLDQFVTRAFSGLSRAESQRLIENQSESDGILVNGKRARPAYRLRTGDIVAMVRPAATITKVVPEAIPLDIVFEDSSLLVINKSRGMVVHPAPGSESGTLVNAVLAHASDLSGIGGEIRPGIVHRLDKDTGGLIVVAKTDAAHRSLQQQIQSRSAERKYHAIVWGTAPFKNAVVEAAIGRHPTDRKKMAVITDTTHTSRSAVTEIEVREVFGNAVSLWEARLQTGRTHQIRVHSAYIKNPVVGDPLYGGVRRFPSGIVSTTRQIEIQAAIDALNGQALHAVSLSFDHPVSGERLSFQVQPAEPMLHLLALLRNI